MDASMGKKAHTGMQILVDFPDSLIINESLEHGNIL